MNVTVFSATNCAVCHAEMQWLDSKSVAYKNVVVDEAEDGMEQLMEATDGAFQTTPFTLIETSKGKQTVAGFDRAKLQSILGL